MEQNEFNTFENPEEAKMSPEDVRRILGEMLTSATDDELAEVSQRIADIKKFVINTYVFKECEASPYWHALAGSSMKPGKNIVPDPVVQRHIAETVVGSVRRLMKSLEFQAPAAESANALVRDIASFRERLVAKPVLLSEFNSALYQHIQMLQKAYPTQKLTQIPEVQYFISGSEVVSDEGIDIQTISEVMLSVTEKYLELKERIEAELNLGSAEHS